MINNSWLLAYRTDQLTTIFKLFPILASDYFYIIVIALGYWLRPSSLMFKALSFLIPFSTLLNCLLKNIFQIPRPDISLHLITVHDSFGFPSGDVHIAVVFWVYILINIDNKFLKSLCLIPIMGIAISRVYLGVHSVYDVFGALIIGVFSLWIWKQYLEKKILINNESYINKEYWTLLTATIILYAIISFNLTYPIMIPMAIGSLIGFGLSLKFLSNKQMQNKMHLSHAMLFLGIVIAIYFIFPVIKINTLSIYLSLILKFSVITMSILYFIPKLHKNLRQGVSIYVK